MMIIRPQARKLRLMVVVLCVAVVLFFLVSSCSLCPRSNTSKEASRIRCSDGGPGDKATGPAAFRDVSRTNHALLNDSTSGLNDSMILQRHLLLKIERSGPVVPRANVTRIIILTQARSGSTFVAHLIGRAPRSFVVQEPFFERKGAERLNDSYFHAQKHLLRELLHCSFTSYRQKPVPFSRWLYERNAFQHYCRTFEIEYCMRSEFLTKACERAKVMVLKIIRLHLSQLRSWMRENEDLRPFVVLHLVRDPRAIMASRLSLEGFSGDVKSMDPATLCSDIRSDLKEFEQLKRRFPNTTFQVRFEDLMQNLRVGAQALYAALHLDYTKAVHRFLGDHWTTTDERSDDYTIVRNPRTVAFRWLSQLPYRKIMAFQKSCHDVLPMLGYLHLNGTEDRGRPTPLLPRPVVR